MFVDCIKQYVFYLIISVVEFQLIYLGRQHPKGADYFLPKVKQEFMKNKDETDVEQIKKHIAYGRYMVRELESMYQMRKYRAMKQRYYDKQEDR